MTRSLAIMLHHGLGDVICSLPSLWAADRLLGSSGVFDVVVKSPLEAGVLHDIAWQGTLRTHCLPGGSKLRRIVRTLAVVKQLRDRRPQAFLATHIASPRLADVTARLVNAPVSIVPAHDTDGGAQGLAKRAGEHKVQYFARFVIAAGVPIDTGMLSFPPVEQNEDKSRTSVTRVVIAPAVGTVAEQHKRWPEASFAELVNCIARRWPHVVIELLAAPSERSVLDGVCAGIDAVSKARVKILTPSRPWLAVKAMAGAACVITSCSGAAHLAAWAAVPVVGIYGPTNPSYVGAFSDRLYVVRKNWACSPCYRSDFLSGCGTPRCMTDISPGDVLRAITAALNGVTPGSVPVLQTTNARRLNSEVVAAAGSGKALTWS